MINRPHLGVNEERTTPPGLRLGRRSFIKSLWLSLTALALPVGTGREAHALSRQSAASLGSPRILPKPAFKFRRVVTTTCELYKCTEDLKQTSALKMAFFRFVRRFRRTHAEVRGERGVELFKQGRIGPGIEPRSLTGARSAFAYQAGGNALNNVAGPFGDGVENVGAMSWTPLHVPETLAAAPEEEADPVLFSLAVKRMAKYYGAGKTGIARLDRRWMRNEVSRLDFATKVKRDAQGEAIIPSKKVVFRDVEQPVETDDALVVPERVNNVIVIVVPQSHTGYALGPSTFTGGQGVRKGYGEHGLAEMALAEAIRAMGYVAIPTMNGAGLSVPMAIDAGLGQLGRIGHLITPWYGPNVRIGKVFTDMPLVPDERIEFGVTEYCTQCGICAIECPSGAISFKPDRDYEAPESGSPGALKWYMKGDNCLAWWMEATGSCTRCHEVCPYTRFTFPDFWEKREPSPQAFWELETPPFGVIHDDALE